MTAQIEPSIAEPAEGIHLCPRCRYPTFDCYDLCGWCEAEAAAEARTEPRCAKCGHPERFHDPQCIYPGCDCQEWRP